MLLITVSCRSKEHHRSWLLFTIANKQRVIREVIPFEYHGELRTIAANWWAQPEQRSCTAYR